MTPILSCSTVRNDRGNVIIMFALGLVLIFTFVALVVDGTVGMSTQRQLVVTAEQAAVSGLRTLMFSLDNEITQGTPASPVIYFDRLDSNDPGSTGVQVSVRQAVQQIVDQSKLLGRTDSSNPSQFGDIIIQPSLSGPTTAGNFKGLVEAGRWFPVGTLNTEILPTGSCSGGPFDSRHRSTSGCFQPLTKGDLKNTTNFYGANALRVTLATSSPLQHFFSSIFGAGGMVLKGSAIAWAPPVNGMFLVDLSPSITRDTHLLRNPTVDEHGTKAEFALRQEVLDFRNDNTAGCQALLQPFGPIVPPVIGTPNISCRSYSTALLGNSNPSSANISDECIGHVGLPIPTCLGLNLCPYDTCDYLDMKQTCSEADHQNETIHCRDDYQIVDVSNPKTGGTDKYLIDTSFWPSGYNNILRWPTPPDQSNRQGALRGAEPLVSILDGIRYAGQTAIRRARGDKLGLLAFDWEEWSGINHANKKQRVVKLSQKTPDLQALVDMTDTLSPDQNPNNAPFIRAYLFPRGEYRQSKTVRIGYRSSVTEGFESAWPGKEMMDVSNLYAPMMEAYTELSQDMGQGVQKFMMLFTDGMANCEGTPGRSNCENTYANWQTSTNNLWKGTSRRTFGIEDLIKDKVQVHTMLFGHNVAPHTVNIIDSNRLQPGQQTADCMTDREARLNDHPFVDSQCYMAQDSNNTDILNTIAGRFGSGAEVLAAISLSFGEILNPGLQDCSVKNFFLGMVVGTDDVFPAPNGVFYNIASSTNGLWAPIRPVDPGFSPGSCPNPLLQGQGCGGVGTPAYYASVTPSSSTPRQCDRVCRADDATCTPTDPPLQRQIYDLRGRPTSQQVKAAMDVVLGTGNGGGGVPIMIVQ